MIFDIAVTPEQAMALASYIEGNVFTGPYAAEVGLLMADTGRLIVTQGDTYAEINPDGSRHV